MFDEDIAPQGFPSDPPHEPGPMIQLPEPPAPPPAPPCDIYLNDGAVFYVTELDSWQWHERGIFATGKWGHGEEYEEQDNLFPNEAINRVQFDFSAITVPEVGNE